jgi:hypothetical protein
MAPNHDPPKLLRLDSDGPISSDGENSMAKPALDVSLNATFSADDVLVRSPSPVGWAILKRGFRLRQLEQR